MKTLHNPVLRGFNPDPSFVRVGDDCYLASSTFEWFPGVQIHHSRDRVDWRLIAYDEWTENQIAVNDWTRCRLRVEIDREKLHFSASPDGVKWQLPGPVLDTTKLSDDYGKSILHLTGAFIGLCAQDMSGTSYRLLRLF